MAKRTSDNRTWVETSKAALHANVATFRSRIGKEVKFCAVIKSNAYGHGLVETAKALGTTVDWLAVDNLGEALTLKNAHIKRPILILGWTPDWQMTEAIRNSFRLTVSTPDQVRAAKVAAAKAKKKAFLHLKIDTGTTRQGAGIKQIPDIVNLVQSTKNIVVEGLSTHYANIEDTTDHGYATGQLEKFWQAEAYVNAQGLQPSIKHTACSAAALLFPETHFNMVRVGIGMYGLWPSRETYASAGERGLDIELFPALAWRTRIAMIREVKRGTPISYGLTEKMKSDGRVAVLPIGYWDGYDRGLSSVGEVLIHGQRAKVIGRVCMNMTMIDVTNIPEAKAEDVVTLLGEDGNDAISAEELGARIHTINYEVVTRINPQLPRIIV